ncbi:MAG: oxidoreductase, partial [Candidatus Kerfeldbacteria bacterium CG08_land_8_20_14_0_20_42_7]
NEKSLPEDVKSKGQRTYRSITLDGEEIEFSGGFTDLHTKVYERTLAGNGFTLEDSKPAIELVHDIRTMTPTGSTARIHPFVKKDA